MYCPLIVKSSMANIYSHPVGFCYLYRESILQTKRCKCLADGSQPCALEQHLLHLHKFCIPAGWRHVRSGLNQDLGFDEQSRNEDIRIFGEVSMSFADSGCMAITAFISSYKADRDLARELRHYLLSRSLSMHHLRLWKQDIKRDCTGKGRLKTLQG